MLLQFYIFQNKLFLNIYFVLLVTLINRYPYFYLCFSKYAYFSSPFVTWLRFPASHVL